MAMNILPSKYDIIPIHCSDISAFNRCKRYWDFTSPTRNNLRRRVDLYGVNVPLWLGTGIHYALEMFYNPMLHRDPVEAWTTWFDYQWFGGLVTEEWLDRTYDIHPFYDEEKKLYRIRGLQLLHPNPIEEEFLGYKELGIGIMTFYRDYAERNDAFEIVAAETSFSVPLLHPDNGEAITAVDVREQSPNYGKLLEVHARGKRDALGVDKETGKHFIMDHKTAAKVDEDYFTKLDMDQQVSTYAWATEQEIELAVDHVVYNVLRKCFPKPPTPLKNGTPSTDRTKESTTPELFQKYIQDNDLVDWFQGNDKAQGYYNYLMSAGDENFIIRKKLYRNKCEIENTGKRIAMVALDMIENPRIYPNPTGEWLCTKCAFRGPCLAKEDGSDWKDMIDNGYEENRDR